MLRERILTALILAPLAIAGVLWLPTVWVGLLFALVLLLAAEEWARLVGLRGNVAHLVFLFTCIAGMLGLSWAFMHQISVLPVLALALPWWLTITWRIRSLQSITPLQGTDRIALAGGVLTLMTTWGGLVWLHLQPNGPQLLLFLLVLIWVADSGAYFVGRRWGRTKLAPAVSPGKTVAGVYGALGGALASGAVLAGSYNVGILHRLGFVLLCMLTVLISIVGDLYESLLKRACGVKDSGVLLPGHGGVLDRIDSLIAAAPIFALGFALLERAPRSA
jgi:phosphatidate cytidylyltransferase